MTKRLPPPTKTDDLVQPDSDEAQDAVDLDLPVEIVETDRAVSRCGTGLAFAIGFDVRPVEDAFEALAKRIEASVEKAERKPRKRKPRKLKP